MFGKAEHDASDVRQRSGMSPERLEAFEVRTRVNRRVDPCQPNETPGRSPPTFA